MIGVLIQAGLGLAAAGAVLFILGLLVLTRWNWMGDRVAALSFCTSGLIFVVLGMLMALWGALFG